MYYRLNFSRSYPRVLVNFSINPPDRNPISTAVGRGFMGSVAGGAAGTIGANLLLRHNPDLALKAAKWIAKPEHIEYGIKHLPDMIDKASNAWNSYTTMLPTLQKLGLRPTFSTDPKKLLDASLAKLNERMHSVNPDAPDIKEFTSELRNSIDENSDWIHHAAEQVSPIAEGILPDVVTGIAPEVLGSFGVLAGGLAGFGASAIRHWLAKRGAKRR